MKGIILKLFIPLLIFSLPAVALAQTTSGTISSDETWIASMNPIVITGDITIPDGVTLTIEHGTDIRFQENSDDTHWGWDITRSEIIVYGTLDIDGTYSGTCTDDGGSTSLIDNNTNFADELVGPGTIVMNNADGSEGIVTGLASSGDPGSQPNDTLLIAGGMSSGTNDNGNSYTVIVPAILTSTGTASQGWFGIVFSDDTATGTIQYCNIDHSVYGINFTACSTGSPPSVSYCLINDVTTGIYFDNESSPTIDDTTVIQASTAFSCWAYSAPTITNCNATSLTGDNRAVYATEATEPTFVGCAFSEGSVELDMAADVDVQDTAITDSAAGVVGQEYKTVGAGKIPSYCTIELDNCNVIGPGDSGNGIEWDDNLDMLKVEYSRLGGFTNNVWPRWGSIDTQAGIYHARGLRFFGNPVAGYCSANGGNTSLIDTATNFADEGAQVGMTIRNLTDNSLGIVTGVGVTGTCTAPGGAASLIDSTKDFISLGIISGMTVNNTTDTSSGIIATVGVTTLTITGSMSGGATNDSGDNYFLPNILYIAGGMTSDATNDQYDVYYFVATGIPTMSLLGSCERTADDEITEYLVNFDAEGVPIGALAVNLNSTPVVSGTCKQDGGSTQLIDTATDFVTAGVEVNMVVRNTTDGEFGVITGITTTNILNDTLLITFSMTGGATNDNGDSYSVYDPGIVVGIYTVPRNGPYKENNTLIVVGEVEVQFNSGDPYVVLWTSIFADKNNVDLGDLGNPDPFRNWPLWYTDYSDGENEFYGVQEPQCEYNVECEQGSLDPPKLYQLDAWAQNNWWVTTNDTIVNRYVWDNMDYALLGLVHVDPHRSPDEKRTYSVSGRILDAQGNPVEGVRVWADISVQFPGHTVLADITGSDGYYTIYGLLPSVTAYSIVPEKLFYTFSPTSISVPITDSDITGQDFTASLPPPRVLSVSRADNQDGTDYGLSGRTNWGKDSETTNIVISGLNFRQTPSVFLRGPIPSVADAACSNVVWVTSTRLTATVPAGMTTMKNYSVRVVNPDGQDVIWGSNTYSGTVQGAGMPSATQLQDDTTDFTVEQAGLYAYLMNTTDSSTGTVTGITTTTIPNDTLQISAGMSGGTTNDTNDDYTVYVAPGFTIVPPPGPRVFSISPNPININYGGTLTVTGENFITGCNLTIGGWYSWSSLTPTSGGTILTVTHVAGSIPGGTWLVQVTNPDTQTSTDPVTLTVEVPVATPTSPPTFTPTITNTPTISGTPTITPSWTPTPTVALEAIGVAPPRGLATPITTPLVTPGTDIVVVGRGINDTPGPSVSVGATACINVRVMSPTCLLATVPGGIAPGLYDIVIDNNDGQAVQTITNAFSVVVPPTVSSVVINSGGGYNNNTTNITINGSDFAYIPKIEIGTTRCVVVQFVSSTRLTANVPDGIQAGTYDVTVINPLNQSGTLTSGYTVINPPSGQPSILSVSPNVGVNSAETDISIIGSNFPTSPTVRVGSTTCTDVVRVNSEQITATVPSGVVGFVPRDYDVTVTDLGSNTAVKTKGFTMGGSGTLNAGNWSISRSISLSGDLVIPSTATLTLHPGVTLTFAANSDDTGGGWDAERGEIRLYGRLNILGEVDNRVTIKSDSTGSSDWLGIVYSDTTSTGQTEYADISNAIYGLWFKSCLATAAVGNPLPRVHDCTISTGGTGLAFDPLGNDTAVTVDRCNVDSMSIIDADNDVGGKGVSAEGKAAPILTSCEFSNISASGCKGIDGGGNSIVTLWGSSVYNAYTGLSCPSLGTKTIEGTCDLLGGTNELIDTSQTFGAEVEGEMVINITRGLVGTITGRKTTIKTNDTLLISGFMQPPGNGLCPEHCNNVNDNYYIEIEQATNDSTINLLFSTISGGSSSDFGADLTADSLLFGRMATISNHSGGIKGDDNSARCEMSYSNIVQGNSTGSGVYWESTELCDISFSVFENWGIGVKGGGAYLNLGDGSASSGRNEFLGVANPLATYNVENTGSGKLYAQYNWWLTTDTTIIGEYLWDLYDDSSLGIIDYANHLTAPRSYSVEGNVTDSSDEAVPGARVVAYYMPREPFTNRINDRMALTDSNGDYKIFGLIPGDYNVELLLNSGMSNTLNVKIGSSDVTGADLVKGYPVVTSISPATAANTGTVSTTIRGNFFESSCIVKLMREGEDYIRGTGYTVTSSTRIDNCAFNLNGIAPERWDVVVTNTDNTMGRLTAGFLVTAGQPTITSVSPSSMPYPDEDTDTQTITFYGTNFYSTSSIDIGTYEVQNVVRVSLTELKGDVGPGIGTGWHNVTVTNGDGKSATLTNGFYVVPPPGGNIIISYLDPNGGSAGDFFNIYGSGFAGIPDVFFTSGSNIYDATNEVLISSTEVLARVPSGLTAGTWYDVTVNNIDPSTGQITDTGTLVHAFRAGNPQANVTSISPSYGVNTETTSVTIGGSEFKDGLTVSIGDTACTSVSVVSETQVTATVPAGINPGYYDVVVTNTDALAGRLRYGFRVDADIDNDLMGDSWEYQYWGDLDETASGDWDGDGFSNLEEYRNGTNPLVNSDTDGDGLPDYWEDLHGLDKYDPADANIDSDGDGFTNLEEFLANHGGGTDPNNPTSVPENDADWDGDGVSNRYEITFGLNPKVADGEDGADGDPDGDGYTNEEEFLAGSNPMNPNSSPLNPDVLAGTLVILREEGNGDQNIYFYNTIRPGDWSYWDAFSRNPSPLARDLWVIPYRNNVSHVVGVDIDPDDVSELAVLRLENGDDPNLYIYGAMDYGERSFGEAAARNPSPLSRDLWFIPEGDVIAMASVDTDGDSIEEAAVLKRKGDDMNLYIYDWPARGDFSYWDAEARNVLPMARDLWVIPYGDNIVAMASIDADGDDVDELAIVRMEGAGDYNIYLYRCPAPGDWTYWDASSRNPSPMARDLWVIPSGNDISKLCALDVDLDGEDEILVLKSTGDGDVNLYVYEAPAEGDWIYYDASSRNPSPLARDLWIIPARNNIETISSIR